MEGAEETRVRSIFSHGPQRPTIEDVRKIKGFESFTDQEAEQLLDDMELLCRISMLSALNLNGAASNAKAA